MYVQIIKFCLPSVKDIYIRHPVVQTKFEMCIYALNKLTECNYFIHEMSIILGQWGWGSICNAAAAAAVKKRILSVLHFIHSKL
jgi:hypothetical protein